MKAISINMIEMAFLIKNKIWQKVNNTKISYILKKTDKNTNKKV